MMRIAFVVQRYGSDVIGGAEHHCRQIAERLAARGDVAVEVLTSTARDYRTWANYYPPGSSHENGVRIHRFPSSFRRYSLLFRFYNFMTARLLRAIASTRSRWLQKLVFYLESAWFHLQGPYCPTLVAFLVAESARYDAVFFFTYLYYPTVFGLPHVASKAVLVPTAHDEHPFFFYRSMRNLGLAQKIFVNSEPEGALIRTAAPASAHKIVTVGVGIDSSSTAPAAPGEAERYLVYLGRIGRAKRVDVLMQYFLHCGLQPEFADLELVLVGEKDDDLAIPTHGRIRLLGRVSAERKNTLIAHACAVICPAAKESLSLTLLEAVSAGTPVLANADADVHRFFAGKMRCVLPFRGKAEFSDRLRSVLATDWRAAQGADAIAMSQKWLLSHYTWPIILEHYLQIAKQLGKV